MAVGRDVAVWVGVGCGVSVAVGRSVAVWVGVGCGVSVAVGRDVAVWVGVGCGVSVAVGRSVAVWVGVDMNIAADGSVVSVAGPGISGEVGRLHAAKLIIANAHTPIATKHTVELAAFSLMLFSHAYLVSPSFERCLLLAMSALPDNLMTICILLLLNVCQQSLVGICMAGSAVISLEDIELSYRVDPWFTISLGNFRTSPPRIIQSPAL